MSIPQKYIQVEGDRTLAYGDNGDPSSNTLVVFYHGMFGIGNAKRESPTLKNKGVHFISPTLPGWGETSSVPPGSTFNQCLLNDLTALIEHLHPDTSQLKIYMSGGSFGTAPAQIVYGAPYDVFPLGRHITGLLLLAPFSPFKQDHNYQKSLAWPNWLMVGPLGQYLPFNILPKMVQSAMKPGFKTPEGAEKFLRQSLFDKMSPAEKEKLAAYCEREGKTVDEMVTEWSIMSAASVEKNWDGFLSVANILHSDWGFKFPLDAEHSKSRVKLIIASEDTLIGRGTADFLMTQYANATLEIVEGGHISSIGEMDRIWDEFVV